MTDQKQLENAEYFSYLGSIIINDARRTREIKSRVAMAKTAFNKTKALYGSKPDSDLRKKLVLVKCYIWSTALCDAGNLTLWKVDQKYLESLEIWCWRRTEKIKWQDRVKNKEAVQKRREGNTYIYLYLYIYIYIYTYIYMYKIKKRESLLDWSHLA
jgi:hypothetical protein